jgi:glycosyltransferase involved in cell wall biosynthesis
MDLSSKKPFFSIPIPTYGYSGKGAQFLEQNLEMISKQTFKDYEIILSDHSVDDTIYEVFLKWSKLINIKYYKNENGRGFVSPNINNAMKHCNGQWIKILFQDDFLFGDDSLQKHKDFIDLNNDVNWFAACTHVTYDGDLIAWSFKPEWVDDIWTGNNKLGCPSNITIKNEDILYFDEELNWLLDVDYYMKLRAKFGDVRILNEFVLVNRITPERLTSNTKEETKISEYNKLKKIYFKN